jgi:NAD(P)-dependent dehydrogenase (short-subunit alcohol dehydrogenase family)
VMDVNHKGSYLCAKHVRRRIERCGKIVNTASISVKGNKAQSN